MPGRRSLFWPLAVLLVAFSVLVIWLARAWGEYVELQSYHLTEAAQTRLNHYAAEAEQAWRRDGRAGVDRWLERHQAREPDWAVVVGPDLSSLGSRPLSVEEYGRLTFMRRVDWPMSKRSGGLPILSLPFPEAPDAGQLVMRLPERYLPGGFSLLARFVIHGVVPGGPWPSSSASGCTACCSPRCVTCASRPTRCAATTCPPGFHPRSAAVAMSWASWPGPSTTWPSAWKPRWSTSASCFATSPTSCARR